ncbi:MAG: BON domain-containing protein [Pseudomonadales bacterium]|nr:BON domain-containing protein [Pseudomonadales bacterium]MCP5215484.1 BON domain-containing protein [Pseudomonadales bacterium]
MLIRLSAPVVLSLCLLVTGCGTIVSKTTGTNPVGTNASERSFGRLIDDQLIETYVSANILKANEDFKDANVSVTSYNGIVLLTGQVQSEQLKQLASQTAKNVRNVRRVHNEISVAGPISIPARTNDSWLKTKIKSRMLADKDTNPLRVKVVVENGVVYLMGMVHKTEADSAVEIAHKTYGVQKIVKVFEYTE